MAMRSIFRAGPAAVFITVFVVLFAGLLTVAVAGGRGEESAGIAVPAHDDDHHEIEPVSLAAGERLAVVATTNIVGDVVRQVAGDAAEVTVLIAVGQNPHGYTPAPRAIAAIERAHLVIVNGFDLEENLMATVKASATGYVVSASAGIVPLDGHADDDHADDDHAHDAGDPHVWFDPNNVLVWVDNIEDALSDADHARAETFAANAESYRSRLRDLDREIRRQVAAIPAERRKLVLDHASLDYFAARYGFETIGAVIPATTDQAEPSAQAVARLVEQIRAEEVPAIFVGGTASQGLRNLVAAVAAEVGRDVRVGTLLTGSLAPAGEPGDSYVGFMEYNVSQIVENLTD